jgi:hypothetical protein
MADLAPWELDTTLTVPTGTVVDPADIVSRHPDTDPAMVDVVVHDPHASVALPAEVEAWLVPGISAKRRMDYSDFASDALGRHWAALDPHVIYVRNPVNRLVFDPNRFRPPLEDLRQQLPEAIRRSKAALADGVKPSLGGVDSVRPVTFAGYPALDLDRVAADVETFLEVLDEAGTRTVGVYRTTVRSVVEEVIAAKRERLANLSIHDIGADDLVRLANLVVVGLHDTSAFTMTPDDALATPKPAADTLPTYIDFGTRGDSNGDPGLADGAGGHEPTSMTPAGVRALRMGFVEAFGSHRGFTINDPYKGAEETVRFRDDYAVGSRLRPVKVEVVQYEWSRETLLGDAAVEALAQPGTEWDDSAKTIDKTLAPRTIDAHAAYRRRLAGLL